MPDTRLVRQTFYCNLCCHKKFQGRQRKRFNDVVKTSLKKSNIPTDSMEFLWSHDCFVPKKLCGWQREPQCHELGAHRNPAQAVFHFIKYPCSHPFSQVSCVKECSFYTGLTSHHRTHKMEWTQMISVPSNCLQKMQKLWGTQYHLNIPMILVNLKGWNPNWIC